MPKNKWNYIMLFICGFLITYGILYSTFQPPKPIGLLHSIITETPPKHPTYTQKSKTMSIENKDH